LLRDALEVKEFVNADAIALGLSAFQPEEVAIAAGRVMLARIKELARERADFAFETTLASRTFAPWLSRLRASDYQAHIVFLSLPSADLAVARVRERVKMGGHDVPEIVVRRRFLGGLKNFFDLYRGAVDSWQVYDNSAVTGPRLIAAGEASEPVRILDEPAWTNLEDKLR
jgi:predicted ABC-type ATPase